MSATRSRTGDATSWPGVATGVDMLATTRPYYRSTYVFVTRADRGLDIGSFDDPRLRTLKIGVQMIGDDCVNTPPAHALARRGIIDNVRGYMLYGDYAQPNPPAAIVEAVAAGDIDVAVVWGPLAGYFAAPAAHPLADAGPAAGWTARSGRWSSTSPWACGGTTRSCVARSTANWRNCGRRCSACWPTTTCLSCPRRPEACMGKGGPRGDFVDDRGACPTDGRTDRGPHEVSMVPNR